jgi:hypothetical protein
LLSQRTIHIDPPGTDLGSRADSAGGRVLTLRKPVNMLQLVRAVNSVLSARVSSNSVLG